MTFKKVNVEDYATQKIQDNAASAFSDVNKKIKGISNNYDLTMPRDLPASKLPLQMDTSGNVTAALALGVTDGSNAAAGYLGEYKQSVVGIVNFPATTLWGDATSISLTAGDWDVTATYNTNRNGATATENSIGISTTSGNNTTGLVVGSNYFTGPPSQAGTWDSHMFVPSFRISLTATTTVYLKFSAVYTVTQYRIVGARLSARRIR